MILLVDLGNSRLKWAQSDEGWWLAAGCALVEDFGYLLDTHWGEMDEPEQVVVASVSTMDKLETLRHWIVEHWGLAPRIVAAKEEELGVCNAYAEPETLGSDRWAALIEAHHLYKEPLCVVDCGTAVTVDAMDARGKVVGGVILPGLSLMRASLSSGTAGIPGEAAEAKGVLARSTAEGVAGGTYVGWLGAIERIVGEYRAVLGDSMKLLGTGGDLPRLMAATGEDVIPLPDLVLKGLLRIAQSRP